MLGLVGMPEQIWLVVESVDMRKGVEGLTAMAQLALGHSMIRQQKTGQKS